MTHDHRTMAHGQPSIVHVGDQLEVRTADGEWLPAVATSVIEGIHAKNGRKTHDFPVVWVAITGADRALPWPLDAIRTPSATPTPRS